MEKLAATTSNTSTGQDSKYQHRPSNLEQLSRVAIKMKLLAEIDELERRLRTRAENE